MMTWLTLILIILVAMGLIATGSHVQLATEKKKYLGAALVFGGCVLAAHLVPFIVCPWELLSVKGGSDNRFHNILSVRTAWLIDLVEWGLATSAFARAANRVRAAFLVPLALAVIAIVVVGVQMAVPMLGMKFVWEFWH